MSSSPPCIPLARVIFGIVLLITLFSSRLRAVEPDSEARVQALYAEAKSAEASGDSATAIAKYQAIIGIAPKLASAYNNLGLLYFKNREYEQAVKVLEQGLKFNPAMPTASALLGISLSEIGRYAEARPRLEEALRRNPKDSNAEKILANDLTKLGELEAAAGHLRAISRREPGDQETWYLLGQVYMHLSEQALSKMNAIDPDSELVHEMSGEIMENMKNYDGALFEYNKAQPCPPGNLVSTTNWETCIGRSRSGTRRQKNFRQSSPTTRTIAEHKPPSGQS